MKFQKDKNFRARPSGPRIERPNQKSHQTPRTDWDAVSNWYDQMVGEKGSDFHQNIIFPETLKMMKVEKGAKVLDLACGQGAFCRELLQKFPGIQLLGIDASSKLIEAAVKRSGRNPALRFQVGTAQNLYGVADKSIDFIVCHLAIQNMDDLELAAKEISRVAKPGCRMIWVLMHPCFRIPRQSGWGNDEQRKLQYRRIDRYLSPLKIPIYTHPGGAPSLYTWSFHQPLQYYIKLLKPFQWMLLDLEEWASHRQSLPGKQSKSENRARAEIPLFMALEWQLK